MSGTFKRCWSVLLVFLLTFASSGIAPQSEAFDAGGVIQNIITLTADCTTATIGDTIRFTLSVPLVPSTSESIATLAMTDGYGRPTEYSMNKVSDTLYEFTFKVDGHMSGKWMAKAAFVIETNGRFGDFFVSDEVSFMVIPDMSTLWGMQVTPSARSRSLTVGEELKIEILGAFEDGYDRLIHDPALGTTYSVTGEIGIFSVSPEGVVKGLKVGESVLTIQNGNVSTTLKIFVDPALAPAPEPPGPGNPREPSSGSGCNAGLGILALLTIFSAAMAMRS